MVHIALFEILETEVRPEKTHAVILRDGTSTLRLAGCIDCCQREVVGQESHLADRFSRLHIEQHARPVAWRVANHAQAAPTARGTDSDWNRLADEDLAVPKRDGVQLARQLLHRGRIQFAEKSR